MSHFTVLVIGDDAEKQLAPFQENNMGDCPKEYLEFIEYKDADPDEITGKNGYWENPNAKWDWFVVGGRWSNFFKLKTHAAGQHGRASLVMIAQGGGAPLEGHADSARKGDIDFEAMRAEKQKKAEERWALVDPVLSAHPEHTPWAVIREGEKNIEAARSRYWAQPRCAAWKEAEKNPTWRDAFGWDGSPDDFLFGRDKYIKDARDAAITTFAFLKDGKWVERGQMGWFACVSGEKDPETWNAMYAKMLDSLPDDTVLTVVDCHI